MPGLERLGVVEGNVKNSVRDDKTLFVEVAFADEPLEEGPLGVVTQETSVGVVIPVGTVRAMVGVVTPVGTVGAMVGVVTPEGTVGAMVGVVTPG